MVPAVLMAVMVIGKLPPVPVVVVPAIVAVPLPLSVNVSPPGRAPDSVMAGAGAPVVDTVKLNGAPTIEVAALALRMAGATFSLSVSVALVPRLTQSESWPP